MTHAILANVKKPLCWVHSIICLWQIHCVSNHLHICLTCTSMPIFITILGTQAFLAMSTFQNHILIKDQIKNYKTFMKEVWGLQTFKSINFWSRISYINVININFNTINFNVLLKSKIFFNKINYCTIKDKI